MRSTTTVYYIEVKEGNVAKRVPHTKRTKYTEFCDRRQAITFLHDLVLNNSGNQFRLCKSTTTETEGSWLPKLNKP